jgi:hypothetical protein
MFCEAIVKPVDARPSTGLRICEGCGCTDAAACPGGCHWVSIDPPVCSACVDRGELPNAGAPESGLFGAELCPASATPAPHAEIWLDETSGYCARCQLGFVA